MAKESKIEVASADAKVVVKIGLFTPFQIVGGNVYTFIDSARDNVDMVEAERGILCEARSRLKGPAAPAPKVFLVPWSNVTYVHYGQAV